MSLTIDMLKCTGCTACESICPVGCINMKTTKDGFLYPHVETDACINCNLCNTVCHISKSVVGNPVRSFLSFSNEDKIRKYSTSGGFFSLISDWILENNGVVYGATFTEEYDVVHSRAIDENDRNKMRFSKYTQSNISGTLDSVSRDLLSDKLVLFTGTPCQVSGLNHFLESKNISTDNLYTCDFICHGVPSPRLWHDYLHFVMKKHHDKIVGINFRDKINGWHKPQLTITMQNHMQSNPEAKEPFYFLFYNGCVLRESCYTCQYTNLNRPSDITMGDCWGIENSHPELDDNKGLSLLLVNTAKGDELISLFKSRNNDFFTISIEDIHQPHLSKPARKSKKRNQFWDEYQRKPFKSILNKYANYSTYSKILYKTKRIIIRVLGR